MLSRPLFFDAPACCKMPFMAFSIVAKYANAVALWQGIQAESTFGGTQTRSHAGSEAAVEAELNDSATREYKNFICICKWGDTLTLLCKPVVITTTAKRTVIKRLESPEAKCKRPSLDVSHEAKRKWLLNLLWESPTFTPGNSNVQHQLSSVMTLTAFPPKQVEVNC